MPLDDFTAAAAKPEKYIFDLEAEVAAFYRTFPEQKQKIFFIDASTYPGVLYRGEEKDENEIVARLGANLLLQDNNKKALREASAAHLYPDEGYGCLLLNFPLSNQRNLLGCAPSPGMSDAFIFDHETAHLLCEGGMEAGGCSESIADAYAVLRHIQRFGKETGALQKLAEMRTVEMILGRNNIHFTAPVVEKILADSAAVDFSALSPAETVARAQGYAKENAGDPALSHFAMNNLSTLHENIADLMRGDFSALRQFGNALLRTEVPEEYKWGAITFRAMLRGEVRVNGTPFPQPHGPAWNELRDAIERRASRFNTPASMLIIPRL